MNHALFISPGALAHLGARPLSRLPRRACHARRSAAVPRMAQASEGRASRVVAGPFPGQYGEWMLTQGDVDGVTFYRSSLVASASAIALAVALSHTPSANGLLLDALFGVHTLAFGCALASIHIYMKPMHDMLKALYAAGLLGAAGVLVFSGGFAGPGIVNSVVDNPAFMLAVGWQFVALTGLLFKESICFGHVEALALTALVPIMAGGHFLGIVTGGVADAGMTAFAFGYMVFALRKFTQKPEADIGDLSIFKQREGGH